VPTRARIRPSPDRPTRCGPGDEHDACIESPGHGDLRHARSKGPAMSGRRRRRPGAKQGSPEGGAPVPASGETSGSGAGTAKNDRTGKKRPGSRRTGPVTKAVSAGGVVYRREDGTLEIALAARRTRKGELVWGLPKGALEEGETPEQAAIRETREETGLEVVVEDTLGDTRYFYIWDEARIRKLVHMFLMRAVGGDVTQHDDEMEEVRWFPADEAVKLAAYRGERQTLERALEMLR
jgi:8-oxo-dGTP pyrophosphatase MutT (NUDIX family)